MNLVVEIPPPEATIVINEKAGTIAITANVDIAPCVVTVDGMAIRIVDPEPVPQPNQPVIRDSSWSQFDISRKKFGPDQRPDRRAGPVEYPD